MRTFTKVLLVILVIFIIAQFFQPEKNDGEMATLDPFLNYTNPPEVVMTILETSCFDCHSAHTEYPWYNNITPVNYWLANHVNDGKKHFDMSKWDEYSLKQKDHKMEELIEMVEDKEMPLDSYTWAHSEANLSEEQIKSVIDWGEKVRLKLEMESKPQ
ncbi:Haem-binding domain-containing protein [Flavobacteriaceae bacterium MAR_2010_188]|nr:Haem-binding domain-containing protein [Flavobacteriaceae bacterium MAR_2010_188]